MTVIMTMDDIHTMRIRFTKPIRSFYSAALATVTVTVTVTVTAKCTRTWTVILQLVYVTR